MSTVYINRDNKLIWELKQDGSTVPENAITDAILYIPEKLTTKSDGIYLGTEEDASDDVYEGLTLIENATKIEAHFTSAPLKSGSETCFLTLYDDDHPNGIAWDDIRLNIKDWPAIEK